MSLSDFATFSTAISGLAVTASLIYLALQTHQNAKHTKSLIFQARADRIGNQSLAMASSELVSAWLIENGVAATPEEIRKRQVRLQCVAYLQEWRDTFMQHEEGLLSADLFVDAKDALTRNFELWIGLRQFAQMVVRDNAPSSFRTHLAQLLSQAKLRDKAAVD